METPVPLPRLVATGDRPCMDFSLPKVETLSKVQGDST